MFVGIIMACGITVQHPLVVDGCAISTSRMPFTTKEECVDSIGDNVEMFVSSLPEGSYITDAKCVQASVGA